MKTNSLLNANSKDTVARVQAAQVTDLGTDTALAKECDVVLSVVPPRDAAATAQRLIDALALVTRSSPLYVAELNAVAPGTIQTIARRIEAADVPITLIDGAILGGPPAPKGTDAASSETTAAAAAASDWDRPLIPTSGPFQLADIPRYGAALAETLNAKHIAPEIGAASGLKMCFASLTKGYTAIAIQAFTTAQRMGVLPALQDALHTVIPQRVAMTEKALVGMPPKAYRWVREMEEISRTHAEQGGFEEHLFQGAAGVFKAVAEDPVLGQEKVGERKRGRTAEDVAVCMAEGMERKRKKMD